MTAARDAVDGNIGGDIYWQQQARMILPVLVRQAQAGKPIRYKDLGREVGVWHRQLGKPLGCIGYALNELSEDWDEQIPHIQSLVVKKGTGLPSYGFDGFLEEKGYGKLKRGEKRKLLDAYWADIFGYPEWNDVLAEFELEPLVGKKSLINIAKRGSGGEGPEHKRLKKWVCMNPHIVGLPKTHPKGECEIGLPSGDSVDVFFESRNRILAVEVKPASASKGDISRGLFQCVKYRAVVEAECHFLGVSAEIDALLVLGDGLPDDLIGLSNSLGIEIIEHVIPD